MPADRVARRLQRARAIRIMAQLASWRVDLHASIVGT